MVSLVESIANASKRDPNALRLAQDLKQVVERHRGKSPDTLDGVTVYDRNDGRSYFHDSFIHDYNSGVVINRVTKSSSELFMRPNLLLKTMERTPNEPLSVEDLISNGGGVSAISLRRNIHDLRQVLEVNPKKPQIIVSVYGKGYLLRDLALLSKASESQEQETEPLKHSEFVHDHEKNRLQFIKGGNIINLSIRENEVLRILMQNFGKIVGYEGFSEALHSRGISIRETKSLLKEQVRRLRRKVEPEAKKGNFRYFIYVPGFGYRLDDPNMNYASDSVAERGKIFA